MNPFSRLFSSIEVIDRKYVYKNSKRRRSLVHLFMMLSRVPGSLDFGFENELRWNKKLGEKGFCTPRILKVNKRGFLREFVEGKTVKEDLNLKAIYKLGSLIGEMHKKGISLGGDTKLENFVLNKDKLYILDPEFAGYVNERDPTLDLRTAMEEIIIKKSSLEHVDVFIKGYLHGGGDKSYLVKAKNWNYELLFFLSPIAFCDPSEVLAAYGRKLRTASHLRALLKA